MKQIAKALLAITSVILTMAIAYILVTSLPLLAVQALAGLAAVTIVAEGFTHLIRAVAWTGRRLRR